jgi:nitroimidazol reductase NimA-like FMN-containing flavoprotein (pyridoxamine 5'-phosphate oxidase superfamily)
VGALTYLIEMAPETCLERLAGSALGRLGVVVDGRPEIYPVNHVFDGETRSVMFPTNAGTKLFAALSWPWVAYEIDGVEAGPSGDWGWSVLVVGRPEEVEDPEAIARAEGRRDVLWRTGAGVRWVRIVPDKITGRRIGAGEERVAAQPPSPDVR